MGIQQKKYVYFNTVDSELLDSAARAGCRDRQYNEEQKMIIQVNGQQRLGMHIHNHATVMLELRRAWPS